MGGRIGGIVEGDKGDDDKDKIKKDSIPMGKIPTIEAIMCDDGDAKDLDVGDI